MSTQLPRELSDGIGRLFSLLSRTYRTQRAYTAAIRAAAVLGVVMTVLVLIVSPRVFGPSGLGVAAILAMGLAALIAFAVARLLPVAPRRLAGLADQELGASDALTTIAWGAAEHRSLPAPSLLYQRALRDYSGDWSTKLFRPGLAARAPWLGVILAVVLLAPVLDLLLGPAEPPADSLPASSLQAAAERVLPLLGESDPDSAGADLPGELEDLLSDLGQGREPDQEQREALADRVEEVLGDLQRDQLNPSGESVDPQGNQSGDQLRLGDSEAQSDSGPLGSVVPGDDRLPDRDADASTQAAPNAFTNQPERRESTEETAESAGDPTEQNRQLADALSDLADELRRPPTTAGTEELAEEAGQEAGEAEAPPAGGPGEDGESAEGGGSRTPQAQASGGTEDGPDQQLEEPFRRSGNTVLEELPQVPAGDEGLDLLRRGLPDAANDPAASGVTLIAEFRRQAEAAVARPDLSPDERSLVRNYFLGLIADLETENTE